VSGRLEKSEEISQIFWQARQRALASWRGRGRKSYRSS
jgi:hypothetical protein